MFHRYGQPPGIPGRGLPQQPTQAGPAHTTGSSFGQQQAIRPDFLADRSTQSQRSTPSRLQKTQQDSFTNLRPQQQRAALFDQAREQTRQQARFTDPRNLNAALPGGLTQKQRMDFDLLRRTDPLAAQKQLDSYQRNADIRYNKPTINPSQAHNGLVSRRPPTSFNGPRRSF